MAGIGERHAHRAMIVEGQRAIAAGGDHFPARVFQPRGNALCRIAEAEDEHTGHDCSLSARLARSREALHERVSTSLATNG